jgi:hypothetical protein
MIGGFLYLYFSTLQGQQVGESFPKNGKFSPTSIGKAQLSKISSQKNQQVAEIPGIFKK